MANSLFTKRHYEAIAEVLADNRPAVTPTKREHWEAIRDGLADLFEADNERFSRRHWEEACER